MNKIYKVVWSKAKHCYVVTSELAKRQTKGCGARSLRMATVSLGVAASLLCSGAVLPVFGESVAEAARHEITTDTSISSDETSTYADGVKMNASNIALTITSTGKVKMIESAGYNNNTITVQGKVICGSSSSSAIWGAATGTKVYIKTGANVQGEIYAGRDDTSEVSGNKLDISSGTIEGNIFGGVNNNITAYDVKNNAITISGSSITGSVIGGTTLSGKASLNTVNISGDATAITGEVVGGRSANSDATENKVIINGGNFDKSVIGGNTTNGKNATDNKVTIEGGTIAGSIYGGWSQNGTGTANSNEVHISGGTIDSEVSGGYVQAGVAGGSTADKGNKVIINGGEVKNGVIGGYSDKGDATYNSASLKGGSVYGIVGGATKEGDATNNSVIIEAGDVKFYYGSVLGGYSDNGDAVDNTVTISGGTLVNTSGVQIKGGEVYDAAHKATGNKVNISNGTIGSNEGSQYKNGFYVIAGDASTRGGNATDNAITISGGSFAGENTFEFYGGKTKNIFTSHSETGEVITVTVAANKNTVEISGGTFSDNENVKIYGAYSSASSSAIFGTDSKVTLTATVDENKVKISGGTFSGNVDVYGGYGTASAGVYGSGEEAVTTLTTNGNTVEISGGTFSGNVNVYGGYGHADGTSESGGGTATSSSSADNNKVIISGGKVAGNVYGGLVEGAATGGATSNKIDITGGEVTSEVHGGFSSSANASNIDHNSVSIGKGATVGGNVYGGKIDWDKSGTVTNNSVTMSGGTVGGLYGGYSRQAHGTGAVSDNTVEMKGGKLSGYGYIVGGYSTENYTTDNPTKVDVKNNVVKMTGDVDFKTNVVGGWAQGSGLVQNNRVEFSANNVDHFGEGEFKASVTGGKGGAGGATDNKVIFNKGKVYSLTGGSSNGMSGDLKGDVLQNTVEMSGGMVYGGVTGGDSSSGNADNNIVTISGGTVNSSDYLGAVVGGCSGGGTAQTENGNQVIINGTANVKGDVSGGADGYYTAIASENTVTVDGSAVVTGKVMGASGKSRDKTKNKVYINKGSVTGDVFGACLDDSNNSFKSDDPNSVWYDGGNANSNEVHISDGTVTGNVYGGAIKDNVTGEVKENKVEIIGGTVTGKVHGGYSRDGNATDNTVTINGGNIVNKNGVDITGGTASEMDNNAKKNKVIISNGTIGSDEGSESDSYSKVVGGYGDGCNATDNTVTIAGGKFTGQIVFKLYGGESYTAPSTGTAGETFAATSAANDNTLDISGGTYSKDVEVYGGWTMAQPHASSGTAIATVTADNNKVSISGGTYSGNADVYGGYVFATPAAYGTESTATAKGTANNNTVEISGGTFSGNVSVYGGIGHVDTRGSGTVSGSVTADKNKVIISGGTINGYIAGGWATASASDNTVTIKDNAEIGKDARIYGGTASKLSSYTVTLGTAANNTVNVEKAITVAALIGGFGDETNSTGNTLNIGATGVQSESVSDFQTIALTEAMAWDNGKTVLSAKNFDYDDSIKAALDISAATNLASATSGQMTLLASQTDNDLNALSLTYADGTATLNSTTTSVKIKDAASSDDDGSGVIVNAQSTHTVSLDADNNFKNVIYKVESDNVTGVTFNPEKQIAFSTTEAARDLTGKTFADTNAVDAENLKFAETNDPLKTKDSMTLVANATGITTEVANCTGKKVAINYKDDKGITFAAEASGDVTVADNAVKYTVGSVKVNGVNLSDWNRTDTSAVTEGWTGSNVPVDAGNFAAPEITGGEKLDIVTASAGFFGTVSGKNAYGNGDPLDNDTENGITVAGYKVGGVKAEDNGAKLTYYAMKKTADTLTLESIAFADGQTARTFSSEYDFTNATINASDTSAALFTNASAMKGGQSMTLVDATGALGASTIANFTDKEFETKFEDKVTENLTIKGAQTDWLKQDSGTKLVYTVGDRVVSEAAVSGNLAWSDGVIHYTNTNYKFDGNTKVNVGVNFTATVDPLAGTTKTMTLLKGATGVAASNVTGTPSFTVTLDQANTTLSAGAKGTAGLSADGNDVTYAVSSVQLQTVTVKNVGDTADTVPVKWTIADGAAVETDGMAVPEVAAGTHKDILQSNTDNFFANVTVNGANAYKPVDFKEESSGVTLAGSQEKGVTLNSEKNHLIYAVGSKDVTSVTLGNVTWQKDATLVDGSSTDYNYSGVTEITADDFVIMNPEDVAADDSMTLLKANATLQEMAQKMKASYNNYEVAPGVTIDGNITGQMSRSGNNVTFTATENKASQLTFGDVEWKDSGALLTRPANIVFDGAKVVTTNIKFTNIDSQVADQTMTLVHKFDGTPSAIEGDHYMVGSGRMGEGAAEMNGNDLIFRTKTGTAPTEATHETVMAMEAGTAVVAAGREFVDSAVEGLGLVSNMAPDGTSTFASMGGGVGRYKTGSHVDTHTWSAVVAVGSKREHKKGSLEWGVFAEYGRGNYTLHDDNGGRGDGDTHYAGGGLLAKWTNKHDVYAEASVRLGRMSDSASNMLTDRLGNSYGYDVHANYVGGHVGFGKIYKVQKTKDLDVYGKFFYTRRNGVDFDAGGNHYSLDSVNSSLLRVGARYGSNDRKWNWYGGLAYEYEFGGESKGTVDGLAIRSASIKGASVRGEIGMRMEATKTNPWKVDIGIFGYGGKHRGFGGSVNVAYMF